MKLEVVVLPVSDVDRAKQFYANLGWRLDVDRATNDGLRVVHFTPPGSQCSILFGMGVTAAEPGSVQGLHLIVSDIETAHNELVAHGVDASEVFHDARGGFNRFDDAVRASGPDPKRRSYASLCRSATQTATAGSSKRSRRDCPAASTRLRRRSAPPGI